MSNRPTQSELEDGTRWEVPAAEILAKKLWPEAMVVKFPAFSHIDLSIVQDGTAVAFLEVKRRYNAADKYDETMVLFEKHHAGRYSQRFFNVPTFSVFIFDDGVALQDLSKLPAGKRKMGRADRPGSEKLYALYTVAKMDRHDELLPEILAAVEG